jgi:RecJ-like exonuclease
MVKINSLFFVSVTLSTALLVGMAVMGQPNLEWGVSLLPQADRKSRMTLANLTDKAEQQQFVCELYSADKKKMESMALVFDYEEYIRRFRESARAKAADVLFAIKAYDDTEYLCITTAARTAAPVNDSDGVDALENE